MDAYKRILKSDGTCSVCNKKEDKESMKCFSCDSLCHVINCADGVDDLCTKTFLDRSFNVWQAAGTHKNITFICPCCFEAKNLQRDVIASNRMSVVEDKVSSVQEDIAQIKNMLTQRNSEFPPLPAQIPAATKKPASSDSVIVIKNHGRENPVNRNTLRQAAVDSRAGVSAAYENKQGNTVLVVENEKAKDRLAANIREIVTDRDIVTPHQRMPTIRVTGMNENHAPNTVFSLAKELNLDKGIKIDDKNFKVLFVRPHMKNPKLFQATVRVSNEIRQAIHDAGNYMYVGLNHCPIFDHFHVKRCNKCQGFNHYKEQCENDPICGKCSGPHETESCSAEQHKCINCHKNNFDNTNHLASDPFCKSYVAAQKKLEQSIGFYKRKN